MQDPVFAMLGAVPGTDIGKQMIEALLPADPSPLLVALSVFSVSMLAVAGLMLAWHTLAGVVATAKEGKVLGAQWHTIWAPIRITLGVGLLVPAFNGATAGQLIVKEVALMSNAMAAYVWQSYAETLVTKPATLPSVSETGGLRLAIAALQKEFCVSALDAVSATKGTANVKAINLREMKAETDRKYIAWPPAYKKDKDSNFAAYDFGYSCGEIKIPLMPVHSDAAAPAWQEAQIRNITELLSSIADVHIGTDYAAAHTPGSTTAAPTAEHIKSSIETIAATFDNAQKAAAEAYVKKLYAGTSDEVLKSTRAEGWVSAGVYWRNLSAYSQTYMEAVRSGASSSNGDMSKLGSAITGDYGRIATNFNTLVNQIFPNPATPDLKQTASTMAQAGEKSKVSQGWFSRVGKKIVSAVTGSEWLAEQFNDLVNWIANSLADVTAPITNKITKGASNSADSVNGWIFDATADPIGDMVNLGHGLISIATSIVIALSVAGAFLTNGASFVVGGQGVFATLQPFGFLVSEILGGIGVFYAYIIPIIPFYYVVMLFVGWVIMIIESIIAVIVWAFLFVRMDGNDLVDQPQRQGVLILFNLLLRPTLGILALILAMTALPLILNVVNRLMMPAFFAAQGSSFVFLIGSVASLVIAAYIHYQIITRTLALIVELPDRIARWFGLPGEGLGETEGVRTAVAAFTGGALGAGSHATKAVKAMPTRDPSKKKVTASDPAANGSRGGSSAPRGTSEN